MRNIKIKTKYSELAAIEANSEKNSKILFLHGWLDNAGSFNPILNSFNDFHFVALDLLGHGLSEHRPPGMLYHFIDTVEVVLDVLSSLNWERTTIIGHSLGGAIGALFAAVFPDKIDKLVLIDSLGPLSAEPVVFLEKTRRAYKQLSALDLSRMPYYATESEAAQARVKVSDMTEAMVKELLPRGLRKTEKGFTWRTDSRLKIESPLRLPETHVLEILKNIKSETLFIEATKGIITHFSTMPELQIRLQSIQKFKAIKIEGGHHVHIENPKETTTAILDFLKLPNAQ